MSNDYCENELIQKTAAEFFHQQLGWETYYAFNNEVIGEANSTFGRKSYKEALLPRRLRAALTKLNPWITAEQINEVKKQLEEHLASASPLDTNEAKYRLLLDGIKLRYTDANGDQKENVARLIDFSNPLANDFLIVQELKVQGATYMRRTDLVGFVNGIPLLFIELKKHTVDIYNAYIDNYRDYQETIPQIFYYNAFIIFSNGFDAKIGTLGSKYEFFHEWKRLAEEEEGRVALEVMLRGVCDKKNFLDLLENFILFDHSFSTTAKILARNHQFLGVNRAVERYAKHDFQDGKLGVFWHTQGSGKSYSMIFFAQKIRRKLSGSPTFVILTDRDELNKQISGTFECCGVLAGQKASRYIAISGDNLLNKLRGNPPFIFTLIQKFNKPEAEPIIPNHEVVIISDEAHRSQYGILAENMCRLLPTASRIGFTGTPLLSSDNITARTFGDYVSVYDFKRAMEDGATVPLYYDPRGEKLKQITNPEITDEILDAIERADLDENQKEKLEQEFQKEIHLLTAEPRLRAIAEDFAENYSGLWQSGKAMFVCLNKVTCVRMYNYVQYYWHHEIAKLKIKIQETLDLQEEMELKRKLQWMEETEMAVVISEEQNEVTTFKEWGLDIAPHREKMKTRELDKDFKDSDHPFRVVFVCAMWLTGFDVKCLSCLYLDKPMKAHTLMQAIARANRVAEGKTNGLIIDYVGIIKALRQALADYTSDKNRSGGSDPTIDKAKLLERIRKLIADTAQILKENGFTLQKLVDASGFAKLALLKDAADAVCAPIATKKKFQVHAMELKRLCRFVDYKELTPDEKKNKDAIVNIDEMLQEKRKHVDTNKLMVEINEIVSRHVSVTRDGNYSSGEDIENEGRLYDISKIDFKRLSAEFARVKHKALLMKDLQEIVQRQLDAMTLTNPTRVNFYKKYNEIIEEYNNDKDRANIEKIFAELLNLTQTLDEETKRFARLNFDNDEQLAIFDLLTSDKTLSKADISKIKTMSQEMLDKVKELISQLDHWADKEETRATVDTKIGDILYSDAPDSIYNKKDYYQGQIFDYFYTRYGSYAGQQSGTGW